MALLKKSLSVLLAVIMIFSTVSVAASALTSEEVAQSIANVNSANPWLATDGNKIAEFTIKFFRYDEDPESPTYKQWIYTEKAAPGEKIVARLYISTDFPAGNGEVAFAYDTRFFNATFLSGASNTFSLPAPGTTTIGGKTVRGFNTAYPFGVSDSALTVGYTSLDQLGYDVTLVPTYVSKDLADNYDLVVNPITLTNNKTAKFVNATDDQWVCQYLLTVKDADDEGYDYVKTYGNYGYGVVPEELVSNPDDFTAITRKFLTSISKAQSTGTSIYNAYEMQYWNANVISNEGRVSVFSNVVLKCDDPADEVANSVFSTYSSEDVKVPTVINTTADGSEIIKHKVIDPAHKKVHTGWKDEDGNIYPLDIYALSGITVGYDDVVLTPVFGDPAETYWKYEVYEMNADGEYPSVPTHKSDEIHQPEGEMVTLPVTPPAGFELDASQTNILSGVVNADNSTVLKAYYKRIANTVTYHPDDTTTWSPDEDTLYGADIPEYAGNVEPNKEGYDFIGWATTENATEPDAPATMPNEDIDLYPVFKETEKFTYTFNANQGVFTQGTESTDDDETIESMIFEKGEATADVFEEQEEPTREGYDFDGWDKQAPATAAADVVFNAKWKAKEYTITFTATEGGTFEGGATTKEVTFTYGEAVEGSSKIPAAPKRDDGYTFKNWTPTLPKTMPADNIKVESEWTKDPVYTIEFKDKDNSAILYATTSGVEGTAVTVPDVSDKNPGYTFAGWVVEGTTEVVTPATTIGKESVVYEATWTPAEFTISFNTDGGTPAIPTIADEYKADISDKLPAEAPEKEGYEFVHWVDTETGKTYKNDQLPTEMPAQNLELTAIWAEKTYNAFFVATPGVITDPGTGTTSKSKNIPTKFGAELTTPANPTRTDGYVFTGWETEDGKTPADFATMPAEDLTFYANWKSTATTTSYTINVYVENLDGTYTNYTVPGTAEIGQRVEITTTGTPTVAGALAVKYSSLTTDVAQIPDDTNANNVLFIASADLDASKNILTAYFKRAEATATFDPNGGSFKDATEDGIISGPVGSDLKAPVLADREGYTGYTWEPEVPATLEKDATYKAVWTKKVSNAKFTINGKEYVTVPYEYGATITAPDYDIPEGKEFSGWTISPSVMGTEDLTFDAKLSDKTYSVTYIISAPAELADKAPADSNAYTHKQEATVLAAEDVAGYEFNGWYVENDKTKTVSAGAKLEMTGDVKLYGEYTKKSHSVQFDLDGGKYDGSSLIPSQNYEVGDKLVNLPDDKAKFEKDGYEFIGWQDKAGNVYTDASEMPDGDLVLVAKWKEVIVPHAIKYSYSVDVEGAPALPTDTTAVKNTKIDLPAAPVAGDEVGDYKFVGWTVNGETKTDSFVMPNEDVEVIGVWVKKDAKPFTITVKANGGVFTNGTEDTSDDTTEKTYTFYEGQKITGIEIPVLNKHTHAGWNPALPSVMPGENLEAEATWKQTSFTITVDANGGAFENGDTTKEYVFEVGETITGIETPKNGEMEFDGWSPEIPTVMPENDVKVSAQWKEKEVEKGTITIDPNGGEFPGGSTDPFEATVEVGKPIDNLPGQPTKEHYEFKGWLNSETGEIVPELPESIDGDVTFTAQWEEEGKLTVTYYLVEGGEVYKTDYYYEGETITPAAGPDVTGFDFDGWVTDLEAGTALPETMGSEDIVAYAILTPHYHNVTYYLDAEKTQVYKAYEDVMFGSEVPVPADPVSEDPNLIFAGWAPPALSVMPDEDLEFVAQWATKPVEGEKYTAKYLVDGNTYALYVLEEGDEIPVPADPVKFGKRFAGWAPAVPETMGNANVEFVAQWEDDSEFVYLIIGGTIVAGAVAGGIIAGSNAAWITGVSIIGGVLVIWGASELIKNTYTVTYLVDGEVYKTYKVLAGAKIPVPADPAKDGATFEGWNPEVPEKMPANDLTFEAEWSGNAATDVEIPDTGSFAGVAAFAVISAAGAGAYLLSRKKKEEN